MKKKLIATLVAGAVLSTGLIGLTACGGGHSINKGEKVDAEGWKTAITATQEAKNYTVDAYQEVELKVTGSMEELGITDLNITGKSKSESKSYYDLENSSSYSKQTVKAEVSGVPEAMQDIDEFKGGDYVMESYYVKDGDTIYYANYSTQSENPEWNVSTTSYVSGSEIMYMINQTLATEKDGEASKVIDLYDAFTYSGGVYSATLWSYDMEVKLSISIKGGYVVGVSMEYTEEDGDENSTMSMAIKVVYNLSGYGSTEVKASDDAKKAVDDYKA